jgi:small-conductance mechanosensitive channel
MATRRLSFAAALLSILTLLRPLTAAQAPAAVEAPIDPIAAAVAQAAPTAVVAEHPATLVYANRAIVELRATVLSRTPSTRAQAAVDLLQRLAHQGQDGRATTRTYGDAIVVGVGSQPVFVIFPADVDPLAGEQLAAKAADATARLQVVLDESVELNSVARIVRAAGIALGVSILYALLLWLVIRIDRRIAARLGRTAERQLLRLPGGQAIAHIADTRTSVHRAFALISFVLGTLLTYAWLAFVLRRFPYTRPWGESLRGGLFSVAGSLGRGVVDALPNLFTLLVIVVLTRFVARLATLAFVAVEEGRVTLPGVHADTAPPTRRIVVALLWLFALIVSYKYLPGSDSEVFKGVSVFVGLIVSLGSTGVMNQIMSGLMVTYSRALRRGDFVRVANVEGTVTSVGALSTKVRTPRNEEITIPNTVVVSHATTNYTRNRTEGVYASTSVTIGYDAPWRQVEALLLLAAQRAPGVLPEPKPVVLQTALQDSYVEYTLFAALEQPHRRYQILNGLHAQIQDAFNEHGVQIMSPRYEADPSRPKIVPPSQWYSTPAVPPGDTSKADRMAGDIEQVRSA